MEHPLKWQHCESSNINLTSVTWYVIRDEYIEENVIYNSTANPRHNGEF